MSEETKLKMSMSQKGKKKPQSMKDKTSSRMKGFKHSDKTKLKMRLNLEGRTGKDSIGWKDGRCGDKNYISWLKNKRNRLKIKAVNELGGHTYGEWELLKKQYNYTCPCCGLSEPFIGQRSENLTEDHIIPLSKGGADLIENIQPLCLSCNIKKHTKIIKY